MRSLTFYFAVALLVLGINLSISSLVLAQEKTNEKATNQNLIEESEFNKILSKAEENLKDKTYRRTKTEEVFADRDAAAKSVKIEILEIVPPNKRREVEEIKSSTENRKIERIWDGKNLYERENNGEWKKYSGGGGIGFNIATGKITTTYKLIGNEMLNGKSVNVYEVESHRIANKFTRTSQYQVEYVMKTKYWISTEGYFLKSLKESEIVGSKSLIRETEIYEYDSNIKIEAPI